MNKPFSFKNLTGTQVGKVSRKFIALVLAAAMVLATVVPYLANGGNGGIDDIDVTAAQTVSENETSSAATTDTAKTRDVYFVNRNSNTEKLELWNENETSDSASDDEKAIWVQQMAEPATDSMDYHFTGDDLTDKSYLTECEVKMSDTGAVDSMGAKIYKAEIPETWSYIAFSYFSTDETYGENTTFQNINGVNYPLSTPTNPRHRTMMIKIDEDNQYIVKTISEGKTAWEDAVTAGLTTSQGFYVDTTLYYADENAKGNGYRKPVSETIDISNQTTTVTETPTPSIIANTKKNVIKRTVASGTKVYFWTKDGAWKDASPIYIHYWGNGLDTTAAASVDEDYTTTNGKIYSFTLPENANGFQFRSTNQGTDAKTYTRAITTASNGDCFSLTSNNTNSNQSTTSTNLLTGTLPDGITKLHDISFAESTKSVLYYSDATAASSNSSTLELTTSNDIPTKVSDGSYTINWTSNNENVVTVTGTGTTATLTAAGVGETTITATLKNSDGTELSAATMTVTVTEGQLAYFDPATLSMTYSSDSVAGSSNSTNVTLNVEDSVAAKISDRTYTVNWNSSDNTVVSHSTAGTALTETLTSHKASDTPVTITAKVMNGEIGVASATLSVTVTSDTSKIIYYLAPSDWTSCYAFFTTDTSGIAVDSSNKFTGMTQFNDTSLVVMDNGTTSIKDTTYYTDYNLFFVKVPSKAKYVIFRNSDVVNSDQSWSGEQEPTGDNIYLNATFSDDKNGYAYSSATTTGKSTTVTGDSHKFTLREGVWIDAGSNTMNWADGEPETLPLTLKQGNLNGVITNVTWSSSDGSIVSVPSAGDGAGTMTCTATSAGAGTAAITATATIKDSQGKEAQQTSTYSITVTEKKYIYYLAPSSWTVAYAAFQKDGNDNINFGLKADGTSYLTNGNDKSIFRQMSQVNDSSVGMDGKDIPDGYTLYRIEVPTVESDAATKVIFLSSADWNSTDKDPSTSTLSTTVEGTYTIGSAVKNNNGYSQQEKNGSNRGHYFGKRTGIWITPAETTLSLIDGVTTTTVLQLGKGDDVPEGYTVQWTASDGTSIDIQGNGETAIVTPKAATTTPVTVTATLYYNGTAATAPEPARTEVSVRKTKRIYYLADSSWTEAYIHIDGDSQTFRPMTKAEGDYLEDGVEIEDGTLFYYDVPENLTVNKVIFKNQTTNVNNSGWPNTEAGNQDPTGKGVFFKVTDTDLSTRTVNGKTVANNGYQYDGSTYDNTPTESRTAHYFSEAGSTKMQPSSLRLYLNKTDADKSGTLTVVPAAEVEYDAIQWSIEDGTVASLTTGESSGDTINLSATVTGLKKGKTTATAKLLKDGQVVATVNASVYVHDTLEVYYDATFSKMLYSESGADNQKSIPYTWDSKDGKTASDNIIYYYALKADGTAATEGNGVKNSGQMELVGDSAKPSGLRGTWNDMYVSAELPADTAIVYFKNSKNKETVRLTIPNDLVNPCFYANTGDDTDYKSENRGGYWGEAWETRDHEGTENVTNILSGSYTGNTDTTYYVDSSFYDYFSDFELNGVSRANYTGGNGASHRNWVTFREFDQALSDYYKSTNNPYVMYTGHFQPPYDTWGYQFQNIGYTMDLYGYSGNAGNAGSYFYTINNSNPDSSRASGHYKCATQGLWANSKPYKTYFNTTFLSGDNGKHAKLANVYQNAKFPLTKTDEYVANNKDGNGAKTVNEYYVFDSAQTTLHLAGDGQLYLKDTGHQNWSKNVNSSGSASGDPVSNTYGFFPLDDTTSNANASGVNHNYGFGTRIVVPFTLSEDGTATLTDGTKVPQVFKFSGDDDVWVFLDGENPADMILDLGGDHGRVNGAINFSKSTDSNATSYNYVDFLNQSQQKYWAQVPNQSTYVSDVKYVTDLSTASASGVGQKINISSKLNKKNVYDGQTHYLYLYYMERGQWESNMRIEMNINLVTKVTIKKQFVRNNTDVSKNVEGTIYAMIKQSYDDGTNETYYAVNPSGTTTKDKYCVAISSDNNWTVEVNQLPAQDASKRHDYKYTVQEVLMSNGEPVALTGDANKDAAGVYYPKAATKGDAVVVDGQAYIVQDATSEDNTSYTLVNTRIATTSLKVQKRFLGTDSKTLPKSIKVKIQRQAYNGTETNLSNISAAMDSNKWEDVTIDGQGSDGWYELTQANTTSSSSGDVITWSKTFDKLMINPENDATKGVYVYRVIEKTATGANGTAATESGTTVTYTDAEGTEQSYWVYYKGSNNDNSYNLYKANTDNTGNTATLSNMLMVHLPSTGAKTAMFLTLTAMLMMAGAGTFGLFGNKKRNIVA